MGEVGFVTWSLEAPLPLDSQPSQASGGRGLQGDGRWFLKETLHVLRPAIFLSLSEDIMRSEGNRPASVALWLRQPS